MTTKPSNVYRSWATVRVFWKCRFLLLKQFLLLGFSDASVFCLNMLCGLSQEFIFRLLNKLSEKAAFFECTWENEMEKQVRL